ncbi:MAG: DUF72 domain-containing protein [Flammeovirgaceae bacterium]|nr:MAG: DUF72 domain-containing protein [Flammeovirgaceae bacterium]
MEFGRVSSDELEKTDFTLPPDHPGTTAILKNQKKKSKSTVFVGCAKWGRPDWVGKIYPKGTKAGDFLEHYARQFNCIELNATFYRMPTRKQTSGWKSKVGDDFKFCPKFVDQITHIKRLKDVDELTDRFLDGISGFEKNLGPVFLMPHPGMGPKTLEVLETFIQSLPKDIELYTELRHKDWFANPEAFEAVFTMLERNQSGSIITDASGRRDCLHMRLTTPSAFIRFVGNGLHPTDYTRCDDWINRMKAWAQQGIESMYFFMHQHEELHSPELCRYLIPKINEQLGTTIHVPEFVSQ